MKILLAFLSVALIGVSAQAQIAHNLSIYSEDGLKFTVTINGELKNEEFKSNVTIENIEHDFVDLVVHFENERYPPIRRKYAAVVFGNDVPKGQPAASVYRIVLKKDGPALRIVSCSPKKIQTPAIIQQTAPPPAEENGIKIKAGGVQIQIKD